MSSATSTIGRENRKRVAVVTLCASALIVACWVFPAFWYKSKPEEATSFWFAEKSSITGWNYQEVSMAKSAEAALVADRLVNGEFSTIDNQLVRVFSAKRYQEKQNEVGLFVHTPDRCWTQAGWKMEPVETNLIELEIHGTRIPIERRLFIGGTKRELVYFFGLVGGQPLPYRLDHNYSVGMRLTEKRKKGNVGAGLRASDNQFWTRIWESFTSRSELLGPKQFIRISTPVRGSDLESGDVLLQRTLHQWLTPGEFQSEFASWKAEHKKL